jgi:hypothetical protein
VRDRNRRDSGGNLSGGTGGQHRASNGSSTNGRTPGNGVRPPGTHARPMPLRRVAEPVDEPVDLMSVQADDELISALSAGMAVSAPGVGGYDDDDRFVAMLAAWKAEVDSEPIPELVDVDTAMATIMAAGRPAKPVGRRARHLVPLAAAAALIVFAVTGVSLGAHSALPGDTLFGVTEVLYTETAQSRQAAVDAQAGISQVNESLREGDTATAAQQLTAIEELMAKVKPEDGAPSLVATQQFLTAKLQETPAGVPTDPEAPLRNGTPRPAPPKIPGKPSRPGGVGPSRPDSSTSSSGSASVTPSADPALAGIPVSTTATAPTQPAPESSLTPSPKPTTEGRPDPTTTTSGLGQSEGSPTSGDTVSGTPTS